jgi:multicomponent Na+:H+ antiporter subunit D
MIYPVLLFPFAAAGIVFALRNLRFAAATFSASAAILLAVLLVLDGNAPVSILLGRSMMLAGAMRTQLAFSLALLAVVFMSSWHLPESNLSWMLSFVSLGFLLWAIAIQVTSLSVLFLVASAVTMGMCAPVDRTRAGLWNVRTLVVISAVGFLLLAAAWIIEHPSGEAQAAAVQMGPILLFLGYWILIAAFPFSVWQLPVLAVDASIPRILYGVIMPHTLLVQIMLQQETVLAPINALVPVLLFYAGLATFMTGAVGVVAQKRLSSMLAYLVLGEMGASLMALGSGASWDVALGATCLMYRGIGLVALSIGIRSLGTSLGGDDLESMRGAYRRAPMAVVGTLIAGLSLAGFPPTSGFAARYSLYRMVALEQMPWAIAMISAGLLPALAMTRFAGRVFQVVPVPGSRRELAWPGALVIGLSALLLVLGFWPQALAYVSGQWAGMLSAQSVAGM